MKLVERPKSAIKAFKWWLAASREQIQETSACGQAQANVRRGWAYYLQEDYELAKQGLLKARDLLENCRNGDPEIRLLGNVYLLLAHLYFNTADYAQAEKYYRNSINHASKNRQLNNRLCYYHYYLGRTYSKQTRADEAFQEYKNAKEKSNVLHNDRKGAFLDDLGTGLVGLYTGVLQAMGPDAAAISEQSLNMAQEVRSEALFLKPTEAQWIDALGAVYYYAASLLKPKDKNTARQKAEKARKYFERSLTIAAEPALKAGLYSDLAFANDLLAQLTDPEQSQNEYYQEAESNFKTAIDWSGDPTTRAAVYSYLISVLRGRQDYQALIVECQRLADLAEENGLNLADRQNRLLEAYSVQADAYLQIDKYDEAVAAYKRVIGLARAIRLNPSVYIHLLAIAYMKKPDVDGSSNLDQAIALFQEAISEQGEQRDPVLYWNFGNAQYQRGHYKQAAEAWEQAASLDSKNADYLNWLGNAYYKIGSLVQAAGAYGRAAEKAAEDEKKALYLQNLGNVYLELKNAVEAVSAYTKLVEVDGQNWNSHYLLGIAYRRANQFDKAEEQYKRALELAPKGAPPEKTVRRSLGFLYQQFRHFDAAIPELEWVRDQDDKDVDVRLSLAECYANKARARETLEQLQAALAAAPADARIQKAILDDYETLGRPSQDVDWLMAISNASFARGDFDTAVLADKQLLKLQPGPGFQYRLGQSLLRAGAYRKAIDALSEAAEQQPGNDQIHFDLAEAFTLQGNYLTRTEARQQQYENAAAEYQRAIEIRPATALYHNRLGALTLQLHKPDKASDHLREAVRLKPENLEFRRELASCLEEQGQYEEALNVLKDAPPPADAPAYLADLANAQALNNRYADAVKAAERINPDANTKTLYDEFLAALSKLAESSETAQHHAALAAAALKLNNVKIAILEYRKALALDPSNAEYHKQLGNALWKRNDFNGAAEEWTKTIQKRTDDALTINNLGTAYDAREEHEKALAQYQRAAELKRDNFVPFYNIGTANYRLGRMQDALDAFSKSASLNKDFAPTHYNIGNCYFRLEQIEPAKAAWQKAVELDVHLAEAQFNLGVALWGSGDKDGAKQKWLAALQADRNMTAAEDNLAAADVGGTLDLEIRDLLRDK